MCVCVCVWDAWGQYQEMANELHVYVFNLLAQREGKAHRTTRTSSVDFGSLAKVLPSPPPLHVARPVV